MNAIGRENKLKSASLQTGLKSSAELNCVLFLVFEDSLGEYLDFYPAL